MHTGSSPHTNIWRVAASLAHDGVTAAMATIARKRGSLPMASDAKMVVTPEGRRWGTIGGGCLEADVTAQALESLSAGTPAVVRHTLNADVAGDLGLSCGGTVELFLEPVPATEGVADLLARAAAAVEDRRRAVMLTGLEWDAGARKALRVDDDTVVVGDWAPPDRDTRGSAHVDDASGTFVEPLPRVPRLLIFGAGHVGAEIARAAAFTDFHVTVVDDRDEFANSERLPHADRVIVGDMRSVADEVAADADDFIVVCTRGHRQDALLVERFAGSPARYVGMLGSRRKREVIWKALRKAGVASEALERVHVPIGLEIGADTPGEIGVSVLAELIRIRRLPPEAGEQGAE